MNTKIYNKDVGSINKIDNYNMNLLILLINMFINYIKFLLKFCLNDNPLLSRFRCVLIANKQQKWGMPLSIPHPFLYSFSCNLIVVRLWLNLQTILNYENSFLSHVLQIAIRISCNSALIKLLNRNYRNDTNRNKNADKQHH